MMDELQSNKKRKFAATNLLPGQKRKKTEIVGGLAAALAQSPSKSSFNNFPVTRSNRITSSKNAKAGPSTPNAASQRRDFISPTRPSSSVSRSTLKKKTSLFERKSPSPESDGTPPLSIIPSTPSPSLKRKKRTNNPIKRLVGNSTPSKTKWLDPNPIELTSDDDGSRIPPPQKRVKHTHRKLHFDVIDLCSESEHVTFSPRRTRTRDEGSVVVILSTDEELDPESPSFSCLAFRETDTKNSPALPSLRDISPPIEDGFALQASPLPQVHDTVIRPKVPVAEEDSFRDENNRYAENVNLHEGSLQTLYNEALAHCPRDATNITDDLSPFSSPKCMPPVCNIRYTTQNQSPTLHTPLFFRRIILRMRARLKPPKPLDVKTFADDTILDSMEASKLNEEREDTQICSDTSMELSAVDGKASEIATQMVLVRPIDFQGALSDMSAATISPSLLVNNLDANDSNASDSFSPLANQGIPLPPEVIMLEDRPVSRSIQTQEVSTHHKTATPERMIPSTISLNTLCDTPSNPDTANVTPQEAETLSENYTDQAATMGPPSVPKNAHSLVRTLLEWRCDAPKISEISQHVTITSASSLAISGSGDALSASKCLSESSIILLDHAMKRNISPRAISSIKDVSSTSEPSETSISSETPMIMLTEPATPKLAGEDASSCSECLSRSPAIPNLSPLTNSNSADTSSSRNSSPSTRPRQSPDSSASLESFHYRLVTPDDSPSPTTPSIKAQKQEPLICSNPFPSVSFLDMDLSELNLGTLLGNSKFDEDDDDISISGMELAYPEEVI